MPAAGDLLVALVGSSAGTAPATGITGPEGPWEAGPVTSPTSAQSCRMFAMRCGRAHTSADSYAISRAAGTSSMLAMILRVDGGLSATFAAGLSGASGLPSSASQSLGPVTPPAVPSLIVGGFQMGSGAGGIASGSPSLANVAGFQMAGANPWLTLLWEITGTLTPRSIAGTAPNAAGSAGAFGAWALTAPPLAGTLKLHDGLAWRPILTVAPPPP
jgi:hypothetical protein